MNDRNQSKSPSEAESKQEPTRGGEQANPKGDADSNREEQANSERSTTSRPRGHTEDPDRTL
jgi:hypothetical protein